MSDANKSAAAKHANEDTQWQKQKFAAGQQKVNVDTPEIDTKSFAGEDAGARTIGSMIGEIVWLMTQSPGHKHLSLADLEWAVMPPIILNQYKLFRDGKKPVGAALWGYLSEEAEQRLRAAGRLAPQDWGNSARVDEDRGLVRSPGGTLWLVELITPFHNDNNKHRDQMLADLVRTAFADQRFKLMYVNPDTGKREETTLGAK